VKPSLLRGAHRVQPRPWSSVPRTLLAALALAVAAQFTAGLWRPAPQARAADLPAPPPLPVLRAAALGDPLPLGQAVTLYLQAFDNQPGLSLPFAALDYQRLEAWLSRLLELDPHAQYPLLLAAQVYAQVPDAAKQRTMLDFVRRSFDADPDRRWRWLAHAAIVARHRLGDTELAIGYARAISERATGPAVPGWARQMSVLLLADTGEVEAAKVLLGGLLASGAQFDPHELKFLLQRLEPATGAATGR
jgi:hypothetical protein